MIAESYNSMFPVIKPSSCEIDGPGFINKIHDLYMNHILTKKKIEPGFLKGPISFVFLKHHIVRKID
jgi:hypothetical protein